ncbi:MULTISPECIES: RGCVC family protein [unclassified Saccharothrix]|uniref:RGCVC family protein n=1 Tax=unclassified Saccharothrix TaxID=2593673 RepID=UPI00307E2A0A
MSTTPALIDPLAPEARVERSCPACTHPADTHDALSRRFCAATRAGGLHRGCLCSGESSSATYGKPGQQNISDRA